MLERVTRNAPIISGFNSQFATKLMITHQPTHYCCRYLPINGFEYTSFIYEIHYGAK